MGSNYLKVFNILLSLLVYTNVYASLTQGTLPDNDEIDFGYTKKPDTHDDITGNRVETGIEAWDAQCFAPARNVVSKMMGSSVERTTTENTYTVFGNGTFALKKTVIETKDPDMFYSTTYREYDPQTETLLSEKEEGDCMDNYHETVYSNFIDYDKATGNLKSRNIEEVPIGQEFVDSLSKDSVIFTGPIKGLENTLALGDAGTFLPGSDLGQFFIGQKETYSYDTSDRLIQVNRGNKVFQTLEYDDNGNILVNTRVGTYNYDDEKIHAVTSIDVAGYDAA